MNKFFYNLTKRNWGVWSHFILANQGALWLCLLFPPAWVFTFLILLGAANGVVQLHKGEDTKRGQFEDWGAEYVGFILAGLFLHFGGLI